MSGITDKMYTLLGTVWSNPSTYVLNSFYTSLLRNFAPLFPPFTPSISVSPCFWLSRVIFRKVCHDKENSMLLFLTVTLFLSLFHAFLLGPHSCHGFVSSLVLTFHPQCSCCFFNIPLSYSYSVSSFLP
jgi:hypothetical protein